ncbi:MAG: protein translocase subunit SecF, partial [Idiomarinaceae bacterium]|nr:protein translocase subunit SecF [Idiomarinaceae bacterium]
MREIISTDERIPFMRFRGMFAIISGLLLVASIVSLSVNKLNFGLDFTGGTLIEVGFQQPADLNQVRSVLDDNGFGDAVVQNYGTQQDLLIRLEPRTDVKAEQLGTTILDALRANIDAGIEMR